MKFYNFSQHHQDEIGNLNSMPVYENIVLGNSNKTMNEKLMNDLLDEIMSEKERELMKEGVPGNTRIIGRGHVNVKKFKKLYLKELQKNKWLVMKDHLPLPDDVLKIIYNYSPPSLDRRDTLLNPFLNPPIVIPSSQIRRA